MNRKMSRFHVSVELNNSSTVSSKAFYLQKYQIYTVVCQLLQHDSMANISLFVDRPPVRDSVVCWCMLIIRFRSKKDKALDRVISKEAWAKSKKKHNVPCFRYSSGHKATCNENFI